MALIVGLVLIGALFVVAILGIVAAIAVPNFLTAKQRSQQKRTMANIRLLGTAVESYATDNNAYPRAQSMDQLEPLLVPKYLGSVPRTDGWGNELRYRCSDDACSSYAISSSGADRIYEHVLAREYEQGTTSSFDEDIVFIDGKFVRYPGGAH